MYYLYTGSPYKNRIKFTPPQTRLSKEKKKNQQRLQIQRPDTREDEIPVEGTDKSKNRGKSTLGDQDVKCHTSRACSEIRAEGCADEPTCNVWEERN